MKLCKEWKEETETETIINYCQLLGDIVDKLVPLTDFLLTWNQEYKYSTNYIT